MTTILITGASGQVGQEFQALAAAYPQFKFLFTNRTSLDIGDANKIEAFFHQHKIDFCVNCAAYTAVDKAESEEDVAMLYNAEAVRYLAIQCHMQGIPLIHISTDYVYHSEQNKPFVESDIPAPKGAYARSKFLGEYAAFEHHAKTIVLRTSRQCFVWVQKEKA
jgi:dTDP-4-dehydrorhamnose reductase